MSAQQQSPVREPFAAVDVIRAKRDGGRLDEPRIRWAVDAYVRGVLSEEQMGCAARGFERSEQGEGFEVQWEAWENLRTAAGRPFPT